MYKPKFDKAYQKIMENKTILDKWDRYLKAGTTPSMSEAKKDEIILSPSMMELRSVLPIFELTFYTLDGLLSFYEGMNKDRVSTKVQKKITVIEKEKEKTKNTLTEVRYYYRIYLEIKKASLSAFPDTDISPGIDTNAFF